MTDETFDRDFWERRWAEVLRDHANQVASRPPNAHLVSEIAEMAPGFALDAGCGHGAEAIWLAARGWRVTAVDFSVAALEHARSTAERVGAGVAERIDWIEHDLGSWQPPPRRFDLVGSLYVHVAGSVGEMVARLAAGVAPGGTILLVGHLPVDPETGEPTPAAGQRQVTVTDAVEVLDPREWNVVVAEERTRAGGTGADAVVRGGVPAGEHVMAHEATHFTARLRLEPVGPANANDLWLVHNDAEVARWYDGGEPSGAEAARQAKFMGDSWRNHRVHKWIAYDRANGEVVGRGGVSRTPVDDDWGQIYALLPDEPWVRAVYENEDPFAAHAHWVEIGWALRAEFRGYGYASEIGRAGLEYAFDNLGVQAVVSCTVRHNVRSRAVMERIGMRYAGEIRSRGAVEGLEGLHDDAPFAVYVLLRP